MCKTFGGLHLRIKHSLIFLAIVNLTTIARVSILSNLVKPFLVSQLCGVHDL